MEILPVIGLGKKAGRFYMIEKILSFLKKNILSAHDFYDQYGGWAIVAARFVPIIRTFAPIVAGIVKMDKKKFIYFNIVGCVLGCSYVVCRSFFI